MKSHRYLFQLAPLGLSTDEIYLQGFSSSLPAEVQYKMLRSLKGLQLGLTPDAVLTDVEEAMEAMGEVTGATVREDITARIFERFCVGK
jgi:tRNA U34 5-carboxymethylaminomethyl modifying GTPase MnmE/TrmE